MSFKEYAKGRNDGLALALKIAEEGGIEELQKEIKFRGVTKINVPLARKDLEKALNPIKEMTVDTVLAMTTHVLADEFGMGKKRLERFRGRFMQKTECLLDDMVSWNDIVQTVKEETGVEISIRFNE